MLGPWCSGAGTLGSPGGQDSGGRTQALGLAEKSASALDLSISEQVV